MKDVEAALKKIAEAKAPFASRGDDSGTHKAEQRLWQMAGVDVVSASGGWYRSTGSAWDRRSTPAPRWMPMR